MIMIEVLWLQNVTLTLQVPTKEGARALRALFSRRVRIQNQG